MSLRLSFVFKGKVNLGFLFQNDVQSKINCFGKEEPQIYNVSLPMDEGFMGICRSLTWTSHLWQVRFGPEPFLSSHGSDMRQQPKLLDLQSTKTRTKTNPSKQLMIFHLKQDQFRGILDPSSCTIWRDVFQIWSPCNTSEWCSFHPSVSSAHTGRLKLGFLYNFIIHKGGSPSLQQTKSSQTYPLST